jgi:hypothetical protein
MPTYQQVSHAVFKVRRALAACQKASIQGDRATAYAMAEEAQHAAFDLKELFGLKSEEVMPPTSPD